MKAVGIKIYILFTFGYFLSYLFRGLNVGFAPYIAKEFNFGASELGLLTSFYFIAFALTQIPAGLGLDTFGPRKTNVFLLCIAALGSAIYALSDNIAGLIIGRMLIGSGVCVCMGAAMLAITQHFPRKRIPMLNGLLVATGGLGGVVVGTPLSYLLKSYTWQELSFAMAVVTLIVAAFIWFGVPDPRAANQEKKPSLAFQLNGVKQVFKSLYFWRICSLPIMVGGAFYATQSLWIKPFLLEVEKIDAAYADKLISLLGITMIISTVLTGLIARRLERFGINLYWFGGLGMVVFILIQVLILCNIALPLYVLWGAYGFFGAFSILAYALTTESFPQHLVGRAITSFNMLYFISIFIMQIGIGFIVDIWPDTNGTHPPIAHIVAWGIVLIFQVMGAIWYFWPYPKKLEDNFLSN